jgi:hypothetical protein
MIISIKYFDKIREKAHERYLCLKKMEGKESLTVFRQLKRILESRELYKKISAISTDSEAALCSLENGVCGHLLKERKNLIAVHCVAHRLVLCAKDLVQSNIQFKALNNLVHGLCSFFTRSPKKMEILLKEEAKMLEDQLKLFMPLDERWLSHYPAVKRIIKIYSSLICALQELSGEYPMASAYHTQLTKFRVIGLLHAFADVLHILYTLCQLLQKRDLRIDELLAGIKCAQAGLECIRNNQSCHYFESFLSSFDPIEKILSKEVKVLYDEDMEKDVTNIRRIIHEACKIAQEHLERRFQNMQMLETLQIFDPHKIRILENQQVQEYGIPEVINLINTLNVHYLSEDKTLIKEEVLSG